MDVVTTVIGAILLAIAMHDMISTTVAVSGGGGPLTQRLTSLAWTVALQVHERLGRRRILQATGPVLLFLIVLTWAALLITGWALILDPPVLGASTAAAEDASMLDRFYYASSVVMGRGGVADTPTDTAWVIAEQIAGATGVAVVSLAIAYVLPVVNAIVNGRQLAAYISTLGHTPEQVINRSWNGEDFGDLDLHLIALAPMIVDQAERHLAYPVLFYFHSIERHSALGASVAVLDETLSTIDCCHKGRVQDTAVVPTRIAITEFLDTLRHAYINPSEQALPQPYVGALREAGIPLIEDDEIDEAFADIETRRQLLNALVTHDGWTWEEIGQGVEPHRSLTSLDRIGLRGDYEGED